MVGKSHDISRRSFLKLSALSAAGLAWARSPLNAVSPLGYPDVIESIPTPLPYFALTIDDGFDLDILLKMVDLLEKLEMTATFFMVGRYSLRAERKYPGIMRRLVESGNEIAYHTMTHEQPDGIWELDYLIGDHKTWLNHHYQILGEELYYKSVKPFSRAPWGNFSKPWLRMCQHQHLLPVNWSNDPGSFNRGQGIVRGDIFLTHVRADDFPYILEFSRETGIKPVALGKLIAIESGRYLSEKIESIPGHQTLPQIK